jgi:hypothetical protein
LKIPQIHSEKSVSMKALEVIGYVPIRVSGREQPARRFEKDLWTDERVCQE